MPINTNLSVILTARLMQDIGFVFDNQGNITTAPSGIWSSAIWFANNDADSGYLQLINDGNALAPILIKDATNTVTGFKFNIPVFMEDSIRGGVMYVTLASDISLTVDPFLNLTEGQINNLQSAQSGNFTFGTFEFTLTGGADDQGDLTAISTYGFPMSVTSLTGGQVVDSVGFKVAGSDIWAAISELGSTTAPSVYEFDASKGPLSSNLFAITPTTSVGGSFVPPEGKQLPFSASDWYPYLDYLASSTGVSAKISGTYNGAVAPVNNWVDSTTNTQIEVWHNAGFFDYEVSYHNDLSVQVDGEPLIISGFLLSPTATSQVKGYIVIPKGDEVGITSDWNGGLANSIYSTLGMAQVYAQDPSQIAGQSPFLFQEATSDNNGSTADPATSEFFNVGANTQWGKIFTQFLTGLTAGYLGSTGTPLNPLDAGTVDLSQSWNWDPTYAFDQNLATRPNGGSPSFLFTDNYAKIFFQNSNVYGDMYSDNLMSQYESGSPLLALSNPSGGNVDEITVTLFSASETPTGYIEPSISNYPWAPGDAPALKAPSSNDGTYTLNFRNPAGADGQQNFVVDDSQMKFQVRVWDPSLHNGAGGFSNSAELPAFPTAQVTITGIVGQDIPQGTVLSTKENQQWIVTSTNNFITPGNDSTLNGELTLTVTAQVPDGSVTSSTLWDDLALSFPNSVSYANSAGSTPGLTDQDPQQVIIHFSGDGGASFDDGYVVDASGNKWTFLGGTIDGTTGSTDVTATASTVGVSVDANEAWKGLLQNSPISTDVASVPGLFWSNYVASYDDGVLSIVNQNVTNQIPGELELINLPLAQNVDDVVWYQFIVTDTETQAVKTFNFYPQFGDNTVGSQNIDGGASIALSTLPNQCTINFAGSGTNALPSSLFIPDQTNGAIPLQGTPYAPVIGTQTETYYQFLGETLNFTALTTASTLNQPTSGSNQMNDIPTNSYLFGWTGLNPEALTDGSIGQWTNKVNGLDIVQVNIVDTGDATLNKVVFAQADIDGKWRTGIEAVLDPLGADIQLISKPIQLVAGRTYEISYQEFVPSDDGLATETPFGSAPMSNPSSVLTVTVDGTSGMLASPVTVDNNFIYSLYDGLLDRAPDEEGFHYWAGLTGEASSHRANLVSGVTDSAEFQSKWGNLSIEQFVETAYACILERVPDLDGFNFWKNMIDCSKLTQDQVLHCFLESPEAVELIGTVTQDGYLAIF